MKKHTKAALIVASCLSIGATFLMIHPSQAFFLDLPQQKNGIRQDTDKQMNPSVKGGGQDIRIIKEEMPDKQDKADEKKNPAPDNTRHGKDGWKPMKNPDNNRFPPAGHGKKVSIHESRTDDSCPYLLKKHDSDVSRHEKYTPKHGWHHKDHEVQ